MFAKIRNFDRPTRADPLPFAGVPRSQIEMGEWKIDSELLVTNNAASCIVLAAHNGVTAKGMLGHFSAVGEAKPGPYRDQRVFLDALSNMQKLGRAGLTHIWLGGGSQRNEEDTDNVEVDRQFAERAVHRVAGELGLISTRVTVGWSETGRVIDVVLDCQLGLLAINNYPRPAHTQLS